MLGLNPWEGEDWIKRAHGMRPNGVWAREGKRGEERGREEHECTSKIRIPTIPRKKPSAARLHVFPLGIHTIQQLQHNPHEASLYKCGSFSEIYRQGRRPAKTSSIGWTTDLSCQRLTRIESWFSRIDQDWLTREDWPGLSHDFVGMGIASK